LNIVQTVCVLTAGKGTRMGALGLQLNKALHPIDGKAIISHIIEKFPIDTEFVIGIGYLGEQVRQYLQVAHENRKFTFIEVDNYEGIGSGPGHSLLCCQEFLQKPFYFVSCDTLWTNTLNWALTENWLGVAGVSAIESKSYCNLKIINDRVVELRDKTYVDDAAFQAFVGLCYIKDFTIFWEALGNKKIVAGEHQISTGIQALIDNTDVHAQSIEWIDVGDADKYKRTVSLYENFDFSKKDEALYIVNRKVIKFFVNQEVTQRRVLKSSLNPKVFPQITYQAGQFYAYDFQAGQTLYETNNEHIFRQFLQWLETDLWKPQSISPEIMSATCLKFYQDKTMERLAMYHQKYANSVEPTKVNGNTIPSITNLLSALPWTRLTEGIPCFMHGDLQFDNVLYDITSDKFLLLDWRQEFGGHVEFGDLYYDLAKMYGGIILNYDYIKLNLLSYSEKEDGVFFDFAQRFQTDNYLRVLSNYIQEKGYDIAKVRILVALIYLNMSPLHHYPFDKMLYSLGRELLHKEILMLELASTDLNAK
jgi:NDP-sugar pyrophosphorylase family protein